MLIVVGCRRSDYYLRCIGRLDGYCYCQCGKIYDIVGLIVCYLVVIVVGSECCVDKELSNFLVCG